ncbi:hypothetical protein D3C80_1927220 [compost metagenome]
MLIDMIIVAQPGIGITTDTVFYREQSGHGKLIFFLLGEQFVDGVLALFID